MKWKIKGRARTQIESKEVRYKKTKATINNREYHTTTFF